MSAPPSLLIARRELLGLFVAPAGYIVFALFALGSTLLFLAGLGSGEVATLRPLFDSTIYLMAFLVPAVSMRLLSEELRSGTIEPLMTAPVSDAQVVVGKYLAALGFVAVLLTPLVVHAMVLEVLASPDWGPILTGLLGLLLVASLYVAIGTAASAATPNQIVAFLATVFIIAVLTAVTLFLPRALPWPWLGSAMLYLNLNAKHADFARGIVDLRHVVYFLSGTALFLFLAVKILESKRWR